MQDVLVGFIVAACALYAAWALMPATLKRAAAGHAARLPLPARLSTRLQRMAKVSSGCGCDGCDRNPAAPSSAPKPVHFIRNIPR